MYHSSMDLYRSFETMSMEPLGSDTRPDCMALQPCSAKSGQRSPQLCSCTVVLVTVRLSVVLVVLLVVLFVTLLSFHSPSAASARRAAGPRRLKKPWSSAPLPAAATRAQHLATKSFLESPAAEPDVSCQGHGSRGSQNSPMPL